jgi:hypothetical protein
LTKTHFRANVYIVNLKQKNMSEQATPQRYGIDPETMEVVPLTESPEVAVEAEYAAYTQNVVDELRQDSAESSVSRYAEVYLVDGRGVLMIPRDNPPAYGATVGGNHCYADELKHFPDRDEEGFISLSTKLGLSHENIVAKGTLFAEDGALALEIQDIRKKRESVKWLKDLPKQGELFGIDGGTTVNLKYEASSGPAKLEDISPKYIARTYLKTNTKFDETVQQDPKLTTGVLSSIAIEEPGISIDHHNDISEHAMVRISAQEGHSVSHTPLYEQAGFSGDNPAGFIDCVIDGNPVKIGVRYSSDDTSRIVNIFYDKDYGLLVQPLEDALIKAFNYDIFPINTKDLGMRVTIAKGNTTADSRLIKGDER